MTLSVDTLTIDCDDPKLLADFWCAALGYRVDDDRRGGRGRQAGRGTGWTMLFQVVPERRP